MIKKGDIVGHESKNDFRSVVLGDVLKFYASRAPVRIEYNSKNKKNKITKLAVSITTDILAIEIIEALMRGNLKELHIRPVERNIIKPLYLFLDEEVLLYAKLKKLKFKKINLKKEKISIFVDKLETKHPELKRAIVNSYLELSY